MGWATMSVLCYDKWRFRMAFPELWLIRRLSVMLKELTGRNGLCLMHGSATRDFDMLGPLPSEIWRVTYGSSFTN